MRAGLFNREITVERGTEAIDANGVPSITWAPVATLRAQLVEASTDEFIRAFGASTEALAIFRTRFVEGITLADRVAFEGSAFNIKQLKEIGRRRGLEIRAERIGP